MASKAMIGSAEIKPLPKKRKNKVLPGAPASEVVNPGVESAVSAGSNLSSPGQTPSVVAPVPTDEPVVSAPGVSPVEPTPVEPNPAASSGSVMEEILRPLGSSKNNPVKKAQDRFDIRSLASKSEDLRRDARRKDLEQFYQTGSFNFAKTPSWATGPDGSWANSRAAILTGDVLSPAAKTARQLELTRSLQAGLGDPTLARGSAQRAAAESAARKQVWAETRTAQQERADAFYANWVERNRRLREERGTQAAWGGGTAVGFVEGNDGRHSRLTLVAPDKLSLVARSFGV